MNLETALGKLDPTRGFAEKQGNFVRSAWDRLHRVPGGTRLFSKLVGRAAPYTGTIDAHVVALGENYAKVVMRDKPAVRNHIRCVHAIALANLAELTGNVAVAYTLPDDGRFIVAGMRLEYLKKARGTLTAESRPGIPVSSEKKEYEVVVEIRDASGELCTRAVLETLVGPKRR
ncbi:MAG: DUF4442 domain-containing protein [Sandaracinaceae bacterium]|jgi:uncharacterized protein (TIGR00369 family)|nr:DUF4442 domain-containing protein [Sandaracinaceae bacterium]